MSKHAHPGPLDGHIETIMDILVRNRGTRRSAFSPKDRKAFHMAIVAVGEFSVRVGIFVTDDAELIDAIFDDILDGLRSYIGRCGYVRGSQWLLAMICRMKGRLNITPSERLFIEIRTRIVNLKSAGVGNSREYLPGRMVPPFEQLLFKSKLQTSECALSRSTTSPESIVGCRRGCDLLLLKRLQFHEHHIGRILGMKSDKLTDRIGKCLRVFGPARQNINQLSANVVPR